MTEKHHPLAASCMLFIGDEACKLGKCPDQESKKLSHPNKTS